MAKKINPARYDDFTKHTVAEIADYLGLGKTKTREILDANFLPVTKIGRDYFTSKQCIQDFIQSHIISLFTL